RALLKDAPDADDILRALSRPELGPARRVAVARGAHRLRDVGLPRVRDLGERLLARRVDRRVALLRERLDELAADEEAIVVGDLGDVLALGRGRVVPRRRDRWRSLALRGCGAPATPDDLGSLHISQR